MENLKQKNLNENIQFSLPNLIKSTGQVKPLIPPLLEKFEKQNKSSYCKINPFSVKDISIMHPFLLNKKSIMDKIINSSLLSSRLKKHNPKISKIIQYSQKLPETLMSSRKHKNQKKSINICLSNESRRVQSKKNPLKINSLCLSPKEKMNFIKKNYSLFFKN